MKDKHNDDILAATKSHLQSAGFHPKLSGHPNQLCRLELIRNLLQLMQDPDDGLIDAESGFHTGAFEPYGSLVSGAANKPNRDLPFQGEGSWPTQRCKVGPARFASMLGQYDTECQCESPD